MDDGVHAVGLLSGFTQVLDAKVIKGERALDVLDGVLQNLRVVQDDRFKVKNNPTCMNIGFLISALPKLDRIWKKVVQQNFHAVSWQPISCDAGQAAVHSNHQCQLEDQFHAMIEQEKKGVRQESIFESGVWTYISCNR